MLALGAEVEVIHPPELRAQVGQTGQADSGLHWLAATASGDDDADRSPWRASGWPTTPRALSDPPMIFVHGWCCDRSYFAPQFEHFASGHAVVAVDLRGHGDSGRPASPRPAAMTWT